MAKGLKPVGHTELCHEKKILIGNPSSIFNEKHIRLGYRSFYGQTKRNIVGYSVYQFLYWWAVNYKTKVWSKPTTGRIDHSKGYFFGNIEMQESSVNTAERNSRYTKAVIASNIKTKEKIKFKSIISAAKYCETYHNNIPACCSGKRKSLNGWIFKYDRKS